MVSSVNNRLSPAVLDSLNADRTSSRKNRCGVAAVPAATYLPATPACGVAQGYSAPVAFPSKGVNQGVSQGVSQIGQGATQQGPFYAIGVEK